MITSAMIQWQECESQRRQRVRCNLFQSSESLQRLKRRLPLRNTRTSLEFQIQFSREYQLLGL